MRLCISIRGSVHSWVRPSVGPSIRGSVGNQLFFYHRFWWKCTWRLSFRCRIRICTNFEKNCFAQWVKNWFFEIFKTKNALNFVIWKFWKFRVKLKKFKNFKKLKKCQKVIILGHKWLKHCFLYTLGPFCAVKKFDLGGLKICLKSVIHSFFLTDMTYTYYLFFLRPKLSNLPLQRADL